MDGITGILLGLTAAERWAAARRMTPRSEPQQWFVLIGVAVMLVLLVLLIAISYRRHLQSKGRKGERFDLEAARRQLTARERQIVLAVAARSGLRRPYALFDAGDAFDRGVTQLLAEFARARTPQENSELKAELLRVREKMGFQPVPAGGAGARGRLGSRDIPVGKSLELTGRRERTAVALQAEVIRNDDLELVVALRTPLESRPGDSWLARYCSGLYAWEYRTSTVRCDGRRLVLHHSDEIHLTTRRRFPRVPVRAPALLAHLPFLRGEGTAPDAALPPPGEGAAQTHGTAGTLTITEGLPCAPVFVESLVTEFAGPGLRIETRLQAQVDDRVLVVFPVAGGRGGAPTAPSIVAAVGRVRHGRDRDRGTALPDAIDRVWEGVAGRDLGAPAARPLSIAVELTGLTDEEIDKLAALANELAGPALDDPGQKASGVDQMPVPVGAAT